jgi:hypothetical protein
MSNAVRAGAVMPGNPSMTHIIYDVKNSIQDNQKYFR